MTWDEYFFELADVTRKRSKDPNTQIGAVIVDPDNQVIATGYNGFPRGIEYSSERLERPLKYQYIEHSERNAIYSAARRGVSVFGCRLYLLAMGPPTAPCTDCARAVIQSGIVEVIGKAYKDATLQYAESQVFALQLLEEAGVEFREVS